MRFFMRTRLIGALLMAGGIAGAVWASDAPPARQGTRPFRAAAGQEGPRTYVASGPQSEADLARLQAAIAKLPGITRVEIRTVDGTLAVSIDGDGAASQSMLVAAARTVGFRMRPASPHFFRAVGPNAEADLTRLRAALEGLPGLEQLALSRLPEGAAVRVSGVIRHPALVSAGKSAGFTLEERTSYVASGPSTPAGLARLRSALEKVSGVEQLQMRGLVGGATLLVQGPAGEEGLISAGKRAGFIVWTLGNAEGGREFLLEPSPDAEGSARLIQALKQVEGIGELEIRQANEGARLVVEGGLARPPALLAAAEKAGFTLKPDQSVVLPTVEPQENRNTPPDYESRVLDDQARPGEPAPQFTLLAKDGVTPIRLADYLGKRPVVLLFGSCT